MIKNLNIILAFIAVAVLASCNKEDKTPSIIGKWDLISGSEKAISPTKGKVYDDSETYENGGVQLFEFKTENGFTGTNFDEGTSSVYNGTYTTNGNKLHIVIAAGTEDEETLDATYSIADNKLTITVEEDNWEGDAHYTAIKVFRKK